MRHGYERRFGIFRLCGAYAPAPLRMTSFENGVEAILRKKREGWIATIREDRKSRAPALVKGDAR